MHTKETKMQAFARLLDIMDELRVKCPWDKVQTFESLRPLTIEETYELSEALLKEQYPDVCKELGDILLHLVFYAKIASEKKLFDIQDVCESLCQKLIFRHPHVFGTEDVQTATQVEKNWEKLKLKEKDGNRSVLAGVPETMPSLIKAFRMQDKARGIGFDWGSPEGAWDKVQEELNEVKTEITAKNAENMEVEFGDLLFSLINVARLYKINPDNALEKTNRKFRKRFNYMEEEVVRQGRSLKDITLAEMDVLWEEAKKKME